jgi:CheY-like chemotaxis protein
MVKTLLTYDGYKVETAVDGKQALECVTRETPCVILLDIMMPVMDGVTFAHLLRRAADTELAHTPIVLLTAVSDANAIGEQIGAVDIIPKPIDLDRVAATVARHCRH